jgi:hypothetical protein
VTVSISCAAFPRGFLVLLLSRAQAPHAHGSGAGWRDIARLPFVMLLRSNPSES